MGDFISLDPAQLPHLVSMKKKTEYTLWNLPPNIQQAKDLYYSYRRNGVTGEELEKFFNNYRDLLDNFRADLNKMSGGIREIFLRHEKEDRKLPFSVWMNKGVVGILRDDWKKAKKEKLPKDVVECYKKRYEEYFNENLMLLSHILEHNEESKSWFKKLEKLAKDEI